MKVKQFIIDNKYFLICFSIPLIIFLLFLLAYYPGIISYDGNNQWQQVQSGLITNSHPFFSTYFMLLLSKIHNNPTVVFIYQIILFSIIWGYFCNLINQKSKNKFIIIIFTIFMCLTPIMALYSISLWKDIIYSYYLLAIVVIIYKGIQNNFKYKLSDFILFGILLALICNYRHNGILVAIMYMCLILIIALFNKKRINKNIVKKITMIFISFISVMLIIAIPKKYYLNNYSKYRVKVETKSERENSISIKTKYILWMMGAHLKEGNVTNSNDIDFLNKIINIKKWKKIYNPYIINPISNYEHINGKIVNDNPKKLYKMFLKYTKKYPMTIVKHYINCDALEIDPFSQRRTYLYIFDFSDIENLNFNKVIKSKLPYFQNVYTRIVYFSLMTGVKYLYQPALILYLNIIMLIILSKKVFGKKIYLLGTPMILNTISLLPINLAQDLRYVYINFLNFFIILLVFIINYKKIFKKSVRKNI